MRKNLPGAATPHFSPAKGWGFLFVPSPAGKIRDFGTLLPSTQAVLAGRAFGRGPSFFLTNMAALSRNGRTSPRGKLVSATPPIRLDADTHAIALQLASDHGVPLTEWIRELIEVRCHGVDALLALHQERLLSVAGMNPESITKRR